MTNRTVVVLGGGTGGLVAARRLRRSLDATDRVVLVDRSAEVLEIDPAHRKVETSEAELLYDSLVIALGAELAPDARRPASPTRPTTSTRWKARALPAPR